MPSLGAADVVGLVDHDPEQPRPERGAGAEAPQRTVRLQMRVLNGFLRVTVPAGDGGGHAVGDPLVRPDERGERRVVTCGRTRREGAVAVTRAARHGDLHRKVGRHLPLNTRRVGRK